MPPASTAPANAALLTARLRALALRLPEVTDGVACEGTAVEKRTLKVRGKAFLFLGPADVMLKLGASLSEAVALAEAGLACKPGAHGWVTVRLAEESPELDVLERWVEESYKMLAPRSLSAKISSE